MPPQTPIFADVALQQLCRGRGIMSLPAHDMAATAPVHLTGQRLPSTRPLDQRWDCSRGIIFSNAARACTWSAGHAIVVAPAPTPTPTPTTKRFYASKPVGRSPTATATATATPSPPPGLGDVHRSAGFSMSTKNIEDLKTQIAKLNDVVRELKTEILALKAGAERKDDDIAKRQRDAQNAESSLRTAQDAFRMERKELQDRLNDERIASASERTAASALLENTVREQEARRAKWIKDLTERHGTEMQHLRDHSAPGLASNRPILEAARVEGEQRAKDVLEPLHAATLERLERERSAVKDLERQIDKLKQRQLNEKWDADAKLENANNEATQQRERATRLSNENKELQKELDGRTGRAQNDRPDYHTYHDIFDDLREAVYPVQNAAEDMRTVLAKEYKAWVNSKYRFENDSELALFRQIPQYDGLRNNIVQFLRSRAEQANSAVNAISLSIKELRAESSAHDSASHDSRTITRYLHFGDTQTVPESVNLAHLQSNVLPFRTRRDECKNRIDELQREIDHASPSKATALIKELASMERRKAHLMLFIDYFERVRQNEYDKELLHSSPADKIISRRAREISHRLNGPNEALSSSELALTAENKQQRSELRRRARKIKPELVKSLRIERRRLVYAAELGEDDKEAVVKHDGEVASRLELNKSEEIRLLDAIEKGRRMSASAVMRVDPQKAKRKLVMASSSFKTRSPVGRFASTQRKEVLNRELRQLATARDASISQGKSAATIDSNTASVEAKLAALTADNAESRAAKGTVASDSENVDEASTSISTISRAGMRKRPLRGTRFRTVSYKDSAPSASSSTSNMDLLRASLARTTGTEVKGGLRLSPTASQQAPHSLRPFHIGLRLLHTGDAVMASSMAETEPPQPSSQATDISYAPSSEVSEPVQPSPAEGEETSEAEREPQTMLSYQIPSKDYREAVMASQNSNAAFWSHSLYKSPEGDPIKVFYCKSLEAAERQLKLFLDEPVLGFDMEWEQYASLEKGPAKQNASLIQIAAEEKICLVHIACFTGDKTEDLMPPTLRKILESPDYVKTGVNVVGDANRLRHCFDVNMRGLIELSHLYRLVKFSEKEPEKVSFRLVSLADQVQNVLLLPLLKSDVRVSAWSRVLNQQQSTYAAADAYAGFRLFHKLDNERKLMDPTPPRPQFFETGKPIILGNGVLVQRSKHKSRTVVKKSVTDEAAATDEGDEEDVFFDALEELPDTYELGALAPSTTAAETGQGSEAASLDSSTMKIEGSEAVMNDDQPPNLDQHTTSSNPSPNHPILEPSAASNAKSPKTKTLTNPETQLADEWAHANPPTSKRIGHSTLRAYHLWHHQSFSLQEVATLCREPPLALITVASYVLQAVKEERLDFQEERIREALECLPRSVWPAYARIMKGKYNGADVGG